MIPDRLLPVTATILRAAVSVDPYGNAVDDWATATSTSIRCRVQQDVRSEQVDETGDRLVSRWTLFCNDEVRGGDRVVIGGTTYEVDGPPDNPAAIDGGHHYEATLKVVSG